MGGPRGRPSPTRDTRGGERTAPEPSPSIAALAGPASDTTRPRPPAWAGVDVLSRRAGTRETGTPGV
jgi:hypothetical protein